MKFAVEYELNRAFIYDEDGEPIGETNFVVSGSWLEKKFYDEELETIWTDLDDFLDVYEPETDGEFIYQMAIRDLALVEDFGVMMY